MGFAFYDLIFLALFLLVFVVFLVLKKHNLKRQGLLYLYRTKIGINIIDWTAKKFSNVLKPAQYLVITSGYVLMGIVIWFLIKFSYFYLTSPYAAKALKVPVLMPLIPYLPEIFKIDFLPPFYFTYWIVIIAIIAIPHEFAHGIFARLNKIRVHSTGFGFLGPFLAAFVEPDEKEMAKSRKMPQLAVLASGTFANIIVSLIFALLLLLFFVSSFSAAGVNFNAYSTSPVNISDISYIGEIPSADSGLIELKANNLSYFTSPILLQNALNSSTSQIEAYDSSPAFNSKLSGAIFEINGQKILSQEELSKAILSNSPGDEIIVKTIDIKNSSIRTYNLVLSERNGKAFLGIGIIPSGSLMSSRIMNVVSKIKDPSIYYTSPLGSFGIFIYDLLWWIVLVSISVALVNMVPVGIFDGGRFFYLTILAISKKEAIAKRAFHISTVFILVVVALLMVKWIFVFI